MEAQRLWWQLFSIMKLWLHWLKDETSEQLNYRVLWEIVQRMFRAPTVWVVVFMVCSSLQNEEAFFKIWHRFKNWSFDIVGCDKEAKFLFSIYISQLGDTSGISIQVGAPSGLPSHLWYPTGSPDVRRVHEFHWY